MSKDGEKDKLIEYLVVDTSGFIVNAPYDSPLCDIAKNVISCNEVVHEITDKRQLNRLVCLPYDLQIKDVSPESIKVVTEFSKKTGDYPSLSATDIKVIALTYQLEKQNVGVEHLRTEPIVQRSAQTVTEQPPSMDPDITGFYLPKSLKGLEPQELQEKLAEMKLDEASESSESEDDEGGWITPSNIQTAKKQVHSELMKEEKVTVACLTTDFAMQNVLKQMNLNVTTIDGRIIKQLRTFVLRCFACFKRTSIMTKQFCPHCGNNTLKKVAISLDEDGKMQIHLNPKKTLSTRGKKFSLPRIKGGKHPNNPRLVEDQPMADNKPTRLARTKVNALDDDYIAGFSPFATRDVNSRSAQLGIRPNEEFKYWMRKNPNESRRKRK